MEAEIAKYIKIGKTVRRAERTRDKQLEKLSRNDRLPCMICRGHYTRQNKHKHAQTKRHKKYLHLVMDCGLKPNYGDLIPVECNGGCGTTVFVTQEEDELLWHRETATCSKKCKTYLEDFFEERYATMDPQDYTAPAGEL
jgi:hypothetical protein